jgi:type IV pilus assembly protein PilN
MRDLNFFEPFLDKRQFKFNKMVLLYILLLAVIVGLGAWAGFNQIQINALKKDVAGLKEVAENPETVKKVEEIKAFEEQTNQFRAEVERIRQLDKNIQARDIIGENLLEDINSRLPEGVFLTTLNVAGREIQMNGYATDKYSIAEFGKGLEQLPYANNIFISNISAVESYYRYNMNLSLREVLVDAN